MRHTAKITTFLTTILLASCATPPPPPPPPAPEPEPVVEYVPPPKPALVIPYRSVEERASGTLVRAAGLQANLMREVQNHTYNPVQTGDDLNYTMDSMASYYSQRTGQGWIATGGLVAAQNPDFVAGVRARAESQSRETVIGLLKSQPSYVLQIPGARGAAKDVQANWDDHATSMMGAAEAYKRQAYSLQDQDGWRKSRGDDRQQRAATVKAAQNIIPSLDSVLLRDIAQAGAIQSTDYDGPARQQTFLQAYGQSYKPSVNSTHGNRMGDNTRKALTIGALEILGATDESNATFILNSLTSVKMNRCTNWAGLQFDVCLVAGYYKYEDAFCISEHVFKDLAECMTESAR